MKRSINIFWALLLLAVMGSCTRMELYELSTQVNLKLNLNLKINTSLNLEIDNEHDKEFLQKINGVMPKYMEVMFYDVATNTRRASFILPAEGGTISIAPGDYHLVSYSFGTESTQVGNLGDLHSAKAYTSDITKVMAPKFRANVVNAANNSSTGTSNTKGYEDDPIIHEPDHLYVANENLIKIPSVLSQSEDLTIHATANSIIDIYSLEVLGVTGCENIEKVEAFITGQIKENYFAAEQRGSDPATLYITLKPDAKKQRLYTVFGTFGKLPGAENKIYLDITVTNTGGGQYRYVYDVTDQFEDKENNNNRLVIYSFIDIPRGDIGGGGLAPEVGEWDEEETDIPLM